MEETIENSDAVAAKDDPENLDENLAEDGDPCGYPDGIGSISVCVYISYWWPLDTHNVVLTGIMSKTPTKLLSYF